jgi:branched-chain amino acid aminotransferase
MQPEFLIYNGLIQKTDENFFNANNRALLYGDGFFESIVAFNQNIPLLINHLNRINDAIKTFEFENNELFSSPEQLKNIILYLARKNKLYKGFKIRITFFRDFGGLYLAENNKMNYIIQTQSIDFQKFEYNSSGNRINIYNDFQRNFSLFSKFKTLNSLNNVFAAKFAHKYGFDDVLFLNHKNNIVESTNSNVFFVFENQIFTPKIDEGCVEGVMRNFLINNAKELKINISEKEIPIEYLISADEIFFTNAVVGLKYVSAYQSRRYTGFFPKKIIPLLNEILYLN